MKPLFTVVLVVIIWVVSCTPNKYATTNKVYKKQVKSFAKLLREYPVKDSFVTASPWVGTTNF